MKNKKAAKTEMKKTAAQIKEERAARMRAINAKKKAAKPEAAAPTPEQKPKVLTPNKRVEGYLPKAGAKPETAETPKAAEPKSEKRTIKQLVIESFGKNAAIGDDDLIGAVKKEFPASAFSKTHSAWYRAQARKGLLTGTPIAIPRPARKAAHAGTK